MALYQVFKGHDAYVEYVTVIDAEDIDAAIGKAHSRSLDTWIPAGIVDEFYSFDVLENRIDLIEGKTFEEAVKEIHEAYDFIDLQLKPRQRDIILAALRLWQHSKGAAIPLEIYEIALNGNRTFMTDEDIDDLCEEINLG